MKKTKTKTNNLRVWSLSYGESEYTIIAPSKRRAAELATIPVTHLADCDVMSVADRVVLLRKMIVSPDYSAKTKAKYRRELDLYLTGFEGCHKVQQ